MNALNYALILPNETILFCILSTSLYSELAHNLSMNNYLCN